MTNKQLEQIRKFVIERPGYEKCEYPEDTQDWFENLFCDIQDELGIEYDDELNEAVCEIINNKYNQ